MSSVKNFISNPDQYLLYTEIQSNGTTKLVEAKKGMWTWIRANILERESFKIENVLHHLSRNTKLTSALKSKIEKYNGKETDRARAQAIVSLWNSKFPALIVMQNPPSNPPPLIGRVTTNKILPFDPTERQKSITAFKSSLFNTLLGGTSDHTYKTFKLVHMDIPYKERKQTEPGDKITYDEVKPDIEGRGHLELKVGTWNLMNKGASPKPPKIPWANTPLGIDEPEDVRLGRKLVQVEEIHQVIKNAELDAFAFQEVDFWISGSYFEGKSSRGGSLSPEEMQILQLYRETKESLAAKDWKVLQSQKGSQPLLIAYNSNKLTAKSKFLTPCLIQNGKPRGGEAIFTDKEGRRCFITTVHLEYGVSPQAMIEEYQKEKVEQDLPGIILGDTNNAGVQSAIIDYKHPTNVDAVGKMAASNPESLTLEHAPGINKSYDAAFVNPSSQGQVVIVETEMAYFSQDPKSKKLEQKKADWVGSVHCSSWGEAWKKGENKVAQNDS